MSAKKTRSTQNGLKKRRLLNFEEKMEIFEKFYIDKISIHSLAQQWGTSRSTVERIIKFAKNLNTNMSNAERPISNPEFFMSKYSPNQERAISEMEKLLSIWIEDQIQRNISITAKDTQTKATQLYSSIKRFYPLIRAPFVASDAWLAQYRQRARCRDFKMLGESDSDILNSVREFPSEVKRIIDQGGYLPQQVFNVDRMLFYWKNMPDGTYISKEAEQIASDRVTLVLGCNVVGDCKLKPLMVYKAYELHETKTNLDSLPVYFQCGASSWLTARMFDEWYLKYFIPHTRHYCKENGIPFQILLILDAAPYYRKDLNSIHPNVRVVFFPKGTSTLLQPMDHGIQTLFKAYYLSHTLNMVSQATQGDTDVMVQDVCESYTIRKGITNIVHAWSAIPQQCILSAWRNMCPQFVDTNALPREKVLYKVIRDQIVFTASQLGFEMNVYDVDNLIQWSGSELPNTDLIVLARIVDAEKANGNHVDLTDETKSNHSTDASSFSDDCIDITEDLSEEEKVNDEQDLLTVYSPKSSTLDDDDFTDSEKYEVDSIKIEESVLIEPSLMNVVANRYVAEESMEIQSAGSSEDFLIKREVDTVNDAEGIQAKCLQEDLKVEHFQNPQEMPAERIAEEIELAFDHITCAMEKFESIDPNSGRFQAVRSAVNDMLSCYREMFEEKRYAFRQNTDSR